NMEKKGRVTLPSQQNFLRETKDLINRWGADALRDSDGTKLDEEVKQLDARIYTTYFVARNHNDFAEKHPEETQQLYLLSEYHLATDQTVAIDFMRGYFTEQIEPDYYHDPKKWWEVINRTTEEVVPANKWELKREQHQLIVHDAEP